MAAPKLTVAIVLQQISSWREQAGEIIDSDDPVRGLRHLRSSLEAAEQTLRRLFSPDDEIARYSERKSDRSEALPRKSD